MNRASVAVGLWILAAGIVLVGWGPAQGQDASAPAGAAAPVDPAKPSDSAPDWASLSPRDLADMARAMPGDDTQLKAARQELAAYVTKTYLKDAVAAKTVTVGDWRALAENLGSDLSLADRAAWLDKIVGAYAGSAEALRGLKPDELKDVIGAAKTLGVSSQTRQVLITRVREAFDAGTVASMKYDDVGAVCDTLSGLGAYPSNDLVAAYVDGSSDWRTLEPRKLADLAGRLTGLGDTASKQQVLVARHVMATYLGSTEAVRSVDLETWGSLTAVGKSLSWKDRKAWVDALKGAFAADDTALLPLVASDVSRLALALDPLDARESHRLAYTWFTKSNQVNAATEADLSAVAGQAVSYKDPSVKDPEAVPKALEEFYTKKAAGPLTFSQHMNMMCCWNAVDNLPKVQEWTLKAYQAVLGSEEAREKVTVLELQGLAHWLYYEQMTGEGKGYPAFAQALARQARQGTLVASEPESLGGVLGTPETRQLLRDEVVDAQGSPRLEVVKILASAYRKTGELAAWLKFLGDRLAAIKDEGDIKALWLLARAYTESVQCQPPVMLRGQEWLEGALKTATSGSLQLEAFQDLVRGYVFIGKYDEALKRLDNPGGLLGGPEFAASLALLRGEVEETRYRRDLEDQAAKGRAVAAYREELRRRLDKAKAQQDAAEVARYTQLLGDKN
jgi:hypothetical protein